MSASCFTAGAVYVGPDDPLSPVGEKAHLATNGHGAQLVAQSYEDGTLYQVHVRAGNKFEENFSLFSEIPSGEWSNAYKDKDGGLYMSVWVAHGGNRRNLE